MNDLKLSPCLGETLKTIVSNTPGPVNNEADRVSTP